MREKYLQENYPREESVFTNEHSPGLLANTKTAKTLEFVSKLEQTLTYAAKEKDIIRNIVLAALSTEGLELKPDIIIEAILAEPTRKAQFLKMAEGIMKKNIC